MLSLRLGLLAVVLVVAVNSVAVINFNNRIDDGPTTIQSIEQQTNHASSSPTPIIDTMTLTTVQSEPEQSAAMELPGQLPMIDCFCNMPECAVVAASGAQTCRSRLGCFSEKQPIAAFIPEMSEPSETLNNIQAENETNTKTSNEQVQETFGCLELLPFAKRTCEEILKSMEADASEFPIIQAPATAARSNNAVVMAFSCCQTSGCNSNHTSAEQGSVNKSAQALPSSTLKTQVPDKPKPKPLRHQPHPYDNSTAVTLAAIAAAAAKAKINAPSNSTVTSFYNTLAHANRETFVFMPPSSPDVGPVLMALGEHQDPYKGNLEKVKISDIGNFAPDIAPEIFPDIAPQVFPDIAPEVFPDVVPLGQNMAYEKVFGRLAHILKKRSEGTKDIPVPKQNMTKAQEPEKFSDFDDDIAAEVAAVMATAKSLEISSSTAPTVTPHDHDLPANTESIVQFTSRLFQESKVVITDYVLTIGCLIIFVCLIILVVIISMIFYKRKTSYIIGNYKPVCSNPGQACACTGGTIRGRPRSKPPGTVMQNTAAKNSHCKAVPLLPPAKKKTVSPSLRGGGIINEGAAYVDSTGETTYVMTQIPVPQEDVPLNVYRC